MVIALPPRYSTHIGHHELQLFATGAAVGMNVDVPFVKRHHCTEIILPTWQSAGAPLPDVGYM